MSGEKLGGGMTPERYRYALDEAITAAAGARAEWNRKFVDELDARGLRLAPASEAHLHHHEMNFWAPEPFDEVWRYDYPSIVVPKETDA